MSDISETKPAGVSNTPAGEPINKVTACIDYLTFVFREDYKKNPHALHDVFAALYVDPEKADSKPGLNGYRNRLILANGISFQYGGVWTTDKNGFHTCSLELRGSGCREFENRMRENSDHPLDESEIAGKWAEFIEACLEKGANCTRLDIPVDDFTGSITVDEIKNKVRNKEYTTRMRSFEESTSFTENESVVPPSAKMDDLIQTKDNKTTGYSCTFGSRNHIQLCIYDKKAEQNNKGQAFGIPSWIRFESRFYHNNADDMILLLYHELKQGNATKFIISALKSIFEFKEPLTGDERHKYRQKAWSKWEAFTSLGEKENLFSATPGKLVIETNARWLANSASKSILRVALSLPGKIKLNEIYFAIAMKAFNKLSNEDLNAINRYLTSKGNPPFPNVKALTDAWLSRDDASWEFHQEVAELILEQRTTKELKELYADDEKRDDK